MKNLIPMLMCLTLLILGTACQTTPTINPVEISTFSDYPTQTLKNYTPEKIEWPRASLLEIEGDKYLAFNRFEASQLIKAKAQAQLLEIQNTQLYELAISKNNEVNELVEAGVFLEEAYENQQERIQDLKNQTGFDKWMIRGLIVLGAVGFAK